MSSSKSILIIEDNQDSRELFCEILRDENYQIIEAEDGAEALNYLRNNEGIPDLILMDLTFPHMTADEFVNQLHINSEWQDIPLVVVSGQVDTQEHALRLNAKGFLKKPFDINCLLEAVKEAQLH